jgi:hypothetical protein
MIVATMFHAGFFAIGLNHYQQAAERKKKLADYRRQNKVPRRDFLVHFPFIPYHHHTIVALTLLTTMVNRKCYLVDCVHMVQ